MKATIEIELIPFDVPDYAQQYAAPESRQDGVTFTREKKWALKDLDVETLSDLCDEFRFEVFKKAGKTDPRRTLHRRESEEMHDEV